MVTAAGTRTRSAPALKTPAFGSIATALLGLAVLAVIGLLYLAQTSLVAATGYDIGELQAEQDRWQLRNDQLRLQIAEARSLETVQREATKLGMKPPEKVEYLTIPRARPTVVPTTDSASLDSAETFPTSFIGAILGEQRANR